MSYDHKGDYGKTQLGRKINVPKTHPIFICLSKIDSLHSHLGVTIECIRHDKTYIQSVIFLVFVCANIIPYYTIKLFALLILGVVLFGQYYQIKIQNETIDNLRKQCIIMIRIGAVLSTSGVRSFISDTQFLDSGIEFYVKNTPKLKNFIFRTGSITSSEMHRTCTFAREVELVLWKYSENEQCRLIIKDDILQYINRLSLYLYHMSRYYNYQLGYGDEIIDRFTN